MSDGAGGVGTVRPVGEQSTAELVQHAGEQISTLVRDELALARTELTEKSRHAGVGAGLFGAGGLVSLYALGALVLAAIFGVAEALPLWLSALIIGAALLIVAGLMALIGRTEVRHAMPPTPQETRQSVRADVNAVAAAVKERGRS